MGVRIVMHPYLSQFTNGRGSVYVSGTTIGECLDDLGRQHSDVIKVLYDDNNEIRNDWEIFVNGVHSYPLDLNTSLKDGDELTIMMTVMDG